MIQVIPHAYQLTFFSAPPPVSLQVEEVGSWATGKRPAAGTDGFQTSDILTYILYKTHVSLVHSLSFVCLQKTRYSAPPCEHLRLLEVCGGVSPWMGPAARKQ